MLQRAITDARPFLEFRVDRVLVRGDLGSAEGRARAAPAAMALVAEHPDALVRDSTPWALPIDVRSASMNSVVVAQSPQHRFAPVI